MSRRSSGNPGEAAVLNAFVQAGLDVLLPFGDGLPYDLVVVVEGAFIRVQCKTAWAGQGCLVFNAYATDHGRGQISYVGSADVFGVYFPPTRDVYLVPVGPTRSECRLRLEPAKNNQSRRIRLAKDYEFETWTLERLAMLGSHDHFERPIAGVSSGASHACRRMPRTAASSTA